MNLLMCSQSLKLWCLSVAQLAYLHSRNYSAVVPRILTMAFNVITKANHLSYKDGIAAKNLCVMCSDSPATDA